MSLQPGTPIGPYVVVAAIGAGGMGEVYRATDGRLGRDVAIKVLPALFARDPDRLTRFEQEARALAALNHPNIAQVYGFEEFRPGGAGEAQRALVMELLDGETLRERLTSAGSTGLPARKAIEYASQIARGLAAAHERGIVHRDLKPENVFVLRDGQIKILDFGLARSADAQPANSSQTMTRMAPATDAGTVLGTVGYMAPEQVRGGPIDARTDLFSLGCVVYEMLTGQRAFKRDTPAETMTAILNEDPPDLNASRADLTPALDRIVRHCLEKNPSERFQTARDVAFALNALSGSASAPASVAAPAASASRVSGASLAWAALSAVLAAVVIWQFVSGRGEGPESPSAPYRVAVPLPAGFHDPLVLFPSLRLALSPDGQRLIVQGAITDGKPMLWLASLVDGSFRPIPNTEGGYGPAWAPDNERFFFNVGQRESRTLNIDGGAGTKLVGVGVASWGADDVLIGVRNAAGVSKAAASGAGTVATILERKGREYFGIPWFLADGRQFIYRHWNLDQPDVDGIYRTSIDGGQPIRILMGREVTNINIAEANGALLHMRGTTLIAQAIDPATGLVTGDPVPIAENVDSRSGQGSAFAVSRHGTVVFFQGTVGSLSKLTWMNRRGETLSVVADEADYSNVELSPDGRRILVSVTDPAARARDIFVVDVARGVRQRLTFDPSDERSAVWSRDGRSVVYTSKRLNLYARPSDFTGSESPVNTNGRSKDPREVSPDGRFLFIRETGETTGNDIWMTPVDGSGTPRALAGTPFGENYGGFSPDGKAIVYVSDESGGPEVYVMSIDGPGGRIQVSTGGGSFPRWRRDGKEILYARPDNTIMSVAVSGTGSTFQAGVARALFTLPLQPGPGSPFDVTADGERFLVNAAVPSKEPQVLRMIVNWPALLTK